MNRPSNRPGISYATAQKCGSWIGCFTLCLVLAIQAQAETRYVEGDVIVTFKSSASLESAKAALKKRSMVFSRHFGVLSAKRHKQTGLVRDASKTTAQLMAELKNDPNVESVEPNYLRWVRSAPDDTRFGELWALQNNGQTVDGTTGTAGDDIKFIEAWNHARTTSSELVVAVIDTGIDYTHPDLAANIWVNDQEVAGNGTDDDSDGYVDDVHGYDFSASDADPWDSGDHGTHVAGTIAAVGNNHEGITGINDHVKIMDLKVSNNGETISTSAVISALQYVTLMKNRGVNVVAINASFGGGGSSDTEKAAIQAAGDAGVIFCAAAGNETANNDTTASYPASYNLPNIIVVAATTQNDALASYSNYGATSVDIAAPGSNILSTKPSQLNFKVGSTPYTASELTFTGHTTGVTGTLVYCGLGDTGDFPAAVNGNIAFIERGTLNFSVKVANAMTAGAKAAIIYNNVSGSFAGTLQTDAGYIPTLGISQADGQAIKAMLPVTGTVFPVADYQFLDGTSMATPHVAGAVAFAAMNFPSETMTQRRDRILAAVDVKASLQGKILTSGRLNLLRVIDGGSLGVQPWPFFTTSDSLPGAAVDTPYSTTLAATGGSVPYTFSLTSGALADGLSLSSNGVISGTPTQAGTSTFTLLASDASGPGASKQFKLVTAQTPVSITTAASLPTGGVGSIYSAALAATGGTAPYTWAVTSGSLPAGLTLSSAGVLGGLPATAGSGSFTARATDVNGLAASQAFQFTIVASLITITSPATLPGAVKNVAYNQVLSATGGTAPYSWSVASGALPAGIVLSTSGVLIGTPPAVGTANFTLAVTDAASHGGAQAATLTVTAGYQVPVMNAPVFASTTIGAFYNAQVSAVNYPKTYIATGLPKGLVCDATSGAISGRPAASGVFMVQIKASNSAGVSAIVKAPLVVKALSNALVGSFAGIVARDAAANAGLGGRLALTTTAAGTFTAKVTSGVTTKQATGYLAATAPQISIVINGSTLDLSLDSQTSLISGTHGAAAVTGWRQTWNAAANPSTPYAGYYTTGLELATPADEGKLDIPQGGGYATFTISTGGTLTVAGKTADGLAMTSAGFMGPGGELLVYQSLYANKGSISGTMAVALDPAESFLENTATGTLTWMKPSDSARAYATGFGPINLKAYGKYMAIKATGGIVLGLPETGTAALKFLDGELNLADMDPDVSAFSYSSTNVVTMPAANNGNPAKATLAINKASGAVTGTITLIETNPALTRKVSFAGMTVRSETSTRKAVGWFLLPQIPTGSETIKNSPVLSGKVVIEQP